jgi:hypothetical protein
VHIDTLRDELHRAQIVSRLRLKDSAALLDWLLKQNSSLQQHRDTLWEGAVVGPGEKLEEGSGKGKNEGEKGSKKGDKKRTALDKAITNGFYLGMDKRWIEGEIAAAEAQLAVETDDNEDASTSTE